MNNTELAKYWFESSDNDYETMQVRNIEEVREWLKKQ